jgi:predicted DNA-binding transcriptional regulator AlpA
MGYPHNLIKGADASCFLRLPQVLELIPVGRTTLLQWAKEGKFPKPIKLGPNLSLWKKSDVDEFVERHSRES